MIYLQDGVAVALEVIVDNRCGGVDRLLGVVHGLQQRHGSGVFASSTPSEVMRHPALLAPNAPGGARALPDRAYDVVIVAVAIAGVGVGEILQGGGSDGGGSGGGGSGSCGVAFVVAGAGGDGDTCCIAALRHCVLTSFLVNLCPFVSASNTSTGGSEPICLLRRRMPPSRRGGHMPKACHKGG